ncbi:polysaccharide deacetylase family protein [Proteiniclasticum sp. C24MP]|uniref:polysaccharide deacetylase family protein n=1 Tax=Proteiniclasticum sp. C24MP TaxID=3374101 RepID=UPI0037544761
MKRRKEINDRKKMHSRRNRRKLLGGLLLLVLLGTAGYVFRDQLAGGSKPLEVANSVEDQNLEQENREEGVEPKEPEVEGSVASPEEGPLDREESVPDTRDLTLLKPGTNHSLGASAYAYSTEMVRNWIWGGVSYEGENLAFLTFDDGPVKKSEAVLEVLKRRGVPATFFIPGYVLAEHPDEQVLQRYIEEGHAIAVHSYSHVYDTLYPGKVADKEKIVEEFIETRDLMRASLGDDFDTGVFRFPGGSMSWKGIDEARSALAEIGVYDMDWNAISGDGEPRSRRPEGPQAMAEHVMFTLSEHWMQDIAVVLMHDTKDITAEYLDQVIDQFESAGYTFGILE